MKKYLYIFITSLLLLSGCAEKQQITNSIEHPSDIQYKEQTLSYYDTEEQIKINIFNILENNLKNYQNEGNNILINDDGVIRCISIIDSNVVTYKSISVGDNINKIEESIENVEIPKKNYYRVLFNGSSEEDPTVQNKEEDWLWVNYITDGTYITRIMIYDVKYGQEMR